jgi:enoyl-CoA hydratase
MGTYTTILVQREGAVATVTLNRPDKLNAINPTVVAELTAAFAELTATPEVRAVVLTGAGEKAFAAGADIAAMSEMTPSEARAFGEAGHALMASMEAARFPIIGAVHGFALGGGCELAMACDFLYASDKAKFGQPEVNLGILPGFGGTQRLSRRVGPGKARELCFTGEIIGAEEALRIGLVNKVVPAGELLGKAQVTAKTISEKGPLAIAQCKRVMVRGADVPLPVANELEVQSFSGLFGSADQREGMRAFVDKRPAAFTGK